MHLEEGRVPGTGLSLSAVVHCTKTLRRAPGTVTSSYSPRSTPRSMTTASYKVSLSVPGRLLNPHLEGGSRCQRHSEAHGEDFSLGLLTPGEGLVQRHSKCNAPRVLMIAVPRACIMKLEGKEKMESSKSSTSWLDRTRGNEKI